MLDYDDELAADVPARPPRGWYMPMREHLNTQPGICHYGKDPVDYLDPHNVQRHMEAN